jgi:hypothetical protein
MFMLLFGCALGWLERNHRRHAQEMAVCQEIRRAGGFVQLRPHWGDDVFGRVAGRYAHMMEQVVMADLTQLGVTELPPGQKTASQLRQLIVIQDRLFRARTIGDKDLERLVLLNDLERLNLIGAPISDAGLIHLDGLSNLHTLKLSIGDITDDGLRRIVEYHPDLTTFDLHGKEISDEGLAHIGRLRRLEHLHLPPKVSNAGLAHLRELTELRTLEAPMSNVTGEGLVHLRNLKRLESLNLRLAKIDDDALIHLAELTHLRRLEVSGGYPIGITDEGLPRLARLIKLEELGLAYRNITDNGLDSLTVLRNLRSLDVTHTAVTAQGAKALESKLPRLTVRYK